MNLEPVYAIDTHALIWYLTNPKQLGATARAIFQAAENNEVVLVVSTIVLAELYFANAKNRWFSDFNSLYYDVLNSPFFVFVPIEPSDILDFTLNQAVPEMHDRLIVGLARRLNIPLVTLDAAIVASKQVTVVW